MKIVKGKITITIPTYNEEMDLANCLNAIKGQNIEKEKIEVIIVDNYSKDNTVKVAKSFSDFINIKIIYNKIKDAESSKMIGFKESSGEYFMYLDADMKFADKNFLKKMLYPLENEEKISGVFVKFVVNKNHPALTRTLSYDEFQRDPIFKFFTYGINDLVVEKKEKYWVCFCTKEKISPQGLMIYRKELIKDYIKNQKQLIDNEIPAVLVENGNNYFAFVDKTGVEHLLLRSLKELAKKRIRNLERTYIPNKEKRKFKWVNYKKDWPKIGIWMIYTNSFILPILNSIYKTIKYKDLCFLNEPMLNIVSTYSIIYGVLKNIKK